MESPGLYLDSNVVIVLFEGTQDIREALRQRLADQETSRIVVSDLTRHECRVGPIRDRDRLRLEQFDAFFARPQVQVLQLSADIVDLATQLRADCLREGIGLKTPDALHLAAAISARCRQFWTDDRRQFRQAAGDRLDVVRVL